MQHYVLFNLAILMGTLFIKISLSDIQSTIIIYIHHMMHHLWDGRLFIRLVAIETFRGTEDPREEPENFMRILVRNRHQFEAQQALQALLINHYE